MERILSLVIIVLLCFSTISMFVPQVEAQNGLVGYWKFDEGDGTTAADSSGNGNTGTLLNGPLWDNGKCGKAVSFDGVDDHVQVPASASLDVTSQVTVEAWVSPRSYFSGTGSDSHIVSRSDWSGGHVYVIGLSTDGRVGFSVNPYPPHALSASTIPLNTWTHLAMTYDGSYVRLYINGNFDQGYALSASIVTTTHWLEIGGKHWAGGYHAFFNGLVDEVRIYNRALSEQEIQTDMGVSWDFELSVSPSYQAVSPGKEAKFTISLISKGGFSEIVSLSLSGLPSNAQYSFECSALTPPGSTLLRIRVNSAVGLYRFTVTATGASKTHSADASVFVSPILSPMSISGSFQFNPSKVAMGNAFKLVFTVENLGSEPAFGISITIFVPTGFQMRQDHRVFISMLGPGESSEMEFSMLAPEKQTTGVFDGKISYYNNPAQGGTPLAGFVVQNSIEVVRGFLLSFNLWSPFPLTEATAKVTDHDRDVTWWIPAEIIGESGRVPSAEIRVVEAGNYGATATGEMEDPIFGVVPVWTDKEATFVVSSDITIDLFLDYIPSP